MKKTLYHGTTMDNALSILKQGFDFNKCGSNWGSTYGKGIYFSPSYDESRFYAGKDGIVLSFELNLECYYLEKDISPSKKRKFKMPDGYNCLVNPSGSEYVVFSFISPYINQLLDLYCEYYCYETFPLNKKDLYKMSDDELISMIMETIDSINSDGELEEYNKYHM